MTRIVFLVDSLAQLGLIEDSPTPLHVITTDLLSGRELRLSRGDALQAVIASAAIAVRIETA